MTNHDFIGTEHLLLALIATDEDAVVMTLRAVDVELPARSKVDELRPAGEIAAAPEPARSSSTARHSLSTTGGHAKNSEHIPFTPRAQQTLDRSVHEAQLRGHVVIDAEHVLYALTQEPDATAANVLNSCGVPCESIRQRIELQWRA